MAQSKVWVDFNGLEDGWDKSKLLRSRLGSVKCLVVETPNAGESEEHLAGIVSRSIENAKTNVDALLPLMEKMKGQHDKVPELAGLVRVLKKFYTENQNNPTKQHLTDQAWSLRYLFGVVKHVCYRPYAPKDPVLVSLLRAFGMDCDQWKPLTNPHAKKAGHAF